MNKPLIFCLSIIVLFIIFIIFIKTNINNNNNNNKNSSNNKELFDSLNMLSSGILSFDGLTNNSDSPWTIDKPTKLVITDIIRNILNEINKQTGMSYYFTAYDQLKQNILSKEKTRFTADIFVHEMKNLFTRRILLIFVVNFKNKSVEVEYVNLSNAFKNPPKTFMDYPSSTLILQDDNLLSNEYQIMGRNNSALDFTILKGVETVQRQVPTPPEFQKWILPMGIHHSYQNPQAMFPSRRQSTCWDNNGVNYIESSTQVKMGVKNTPLTRYPYPYINPTVNRGREYNTEYKWMFDLADSHSGFGRGVASSP